MTNLRETYKQEKANGTKRYNTQAWDVLVKIQNANTNVDMLTITGFMNDDQFIDHIEANL